MDFKTGSGLEKNKEEIDKKKHEIVIVGRIFGPL